MAVKIAFLWFGVVIAVSLSAARAGAQLDSNAKVIIHCPSTCGSCEMDVTYTSFQGDTTVESYDFGTYSQYLCLDSISFRYTGRDSAYFVTSGFADYSSDTIQFKVDTAGKMLRELSVTWYRGNNIIYP